MTQYPCASSASAHAAPRVGADQFGKEGLGGGIAVQHAVLPALLVIEHHLHRQARAAGPARVRRPGAVAGEVPGINICHLGPVTFAKP